VLAAVDGVFADPARTPGVAASAKAPHFASRAGHAGLVEVWPVEAYEDVASGDAWSPLEGETAQTPAVRLAERIAGTIAGWLDSGEKLASENRPIRPGDILILVRKRNPFAQPMVAALKARGMPVAGADRIALVEQLPVQDLLAVGDFITLPEDDLALAAVLKSPLFDFDDDDLTAIAQGRKSTLWKALLDNARSAGAYADAAAKLKRWRKLADYTPPYEFLACLLDEDGNRQKFLARLGLDAADVIDELLNVALTYDDGAPPSLVGFLHHVRTASREVKRDMEHGRDEVRVMTVHGAKGLEAPIVFLPDTCSAASGGRNGRPLKLTTLDRPQGVSAPFVWPVKGTTRLAAIQAARNAIETAEAAERNRLLYVAMTRARDRLYVAGFDGKKPRPAECWYDTICAGLEGLRQQDPAAQAENADTWRPVLRITSKQVSDPEKPRAARASTDAEPLPSWAATNAPREPHLAVPLAPSRLAPYETDDDGEPQRGVPPVDPLAEPPTLTPAALADQNRFMSGTLTHALLEHLPGLDPSTWLKAAKAFVAARGAGLSQRTRTSIVTETLAVLGDATFAPLFSPTSRAEVAIIAEIKRPRGSGVPLRLTGQIDRLALVGDDVLIVDYKTNRPPPKDASEVADVYLYQLAAYRLAIREIFPAKAVRAAILWTDGPRIMHVPNAVLDKYASQIWELDPSRLDVP
jgi:ATP-dependent helicase/nuclease subunit A